jgi:hypothetical protein
MVLAMGGINSLDEIDKMNADMLRRVLSYPIDDPTSSLKFSRRLRREQHGWSEDFTDQAIIEYRKFIYLCAISHRAVTPSEEVDRVWHLHILYMEQYEDFCRSTTGKYIKHGPTKGGSQQAAHFEEQYKYTLNLYRREFGSDPPAAFWPTPEVRFGNAGDLRWVDSSTHFIVNRDNVARMFSMIGRVTIVLALILLFLYFVLGCTPVQAQTVHEPAAMQAMQQAADGNQASDFSGGAVLVMVIVGVFCVGLFLLFIGSLFRTSNRRYRRPSSRSSSSSSSDSGGGFFALFDIFDSSGDSGCSSGDSGCGGGGCGGGGCGGGGCGS